MEMRKPGSQGLVVSELGLGCMGMSEFYGSPNDRESIAPIHRADHLLRHDKLGHQRNHMGLPQSDDDRGDDASSESPPTSGCACEQFEQ